MLSFFPRDVFDDIWDLIGSVSESFPTYCFKYTETVGIFHGRGVRIEKAVTRVIVWLHVTLPSDTKQ